MSEDVRERLSGALSKIDRPGSFCVNGSAPLVLPGLEVHDFGPVGLPLTAKQAKELIKQCDQAPYGKGEKTLVDKSVRRVWRMEPDRFALTNPDWNRFIEATVAKVQEELGLEKQKLESHLYDLLLYEPGSFFLPHRDGEKHDRMVATLVVALPSTYEGGELVVRHEGHEQTIDFRGPDGNPLHVHFAAFYADCEHEVRPLRKGYRLCLVYNLTLAKSKRAMLAPRESEHVERIGRLLREWSEGDSAGKLVITLDHQYTAAGLTWDSLKGLDRTKATILQEASGLADCKGYLALLTFHESGDAEYKRRGRGRSYGRRWGESDEYGSGNADDYEMGEIYESELSAKPCGVGDDRSLPIEELSVEEDELLDPEALRKVEPEEEFEGYTGNAGMTLDHWYRHAAILIWPTRLHFEILCDHNGRDALPELERMVERLRTSAPGEKAALKAQCIELGKAILKTWPEQEFRERNPKDPKSPDLLKTLGDIGDATLIGGYFRDLLIKDVTLEPGNSVAPVCETQGWTTFQSELLAVMEATSIETMERNAHLLEQLCTAKPRKKSGLSELRVSLAQALVTAVQVRDSQSSPKDWRARELDRAEVLTSLARSLLLSGQADLLSLVVAHSLDKPKLYLLTPTHMAAMTSLASWFKKHLKQPCTAVTTWLTACREQLESLTARPPEAPKDFRREAQIECKCADCKGLKAFLEDPLEASHRFSVAQDRRKHLTITILDNKCDLDYKTEVRGSPHTLVCTKNMASFHARVKKYEQDRQHLETIRSIERNLPKRTKP